MLSVQHGRDLPGFSKGKMFRYFSTSVSVVELRCLLQRSCFGFFQQVISPGVLESCHHFFSVGVVLALYSQGRAAVIV